MRLHKRRNPTTSDSSKTASPRYSNHTQRQNTSSLRPRVSSAQT
ncbi:hypothetical protein FOXG_14705 [Fusarium oxysporum f. sp. lycopersici 4287]|uniref:Uncharacterized protein n=1 Tax=Fusarium oxysporum f. sp. lycopersici (strain 4287 / CBS 123668 / FGSC 9935 / NRRL 34936) TaxID=426428 RepID=A0A0J9VZA4_FUSO4|nr:hypothetical protein FOXG_14705 [Fusarium oxysporum f. sp. lycopersici 4287]KNB16274.1 hypothetical protein FOXG_14705 [Fusarium oxysporum f. sp. lycopersici 4287]